MMHKFKQPFTRAQQKDFDRQRKGLAPTAEVYEYWVTYVYAKYATPQQAIDSMRAIGITRFRIDAAVKQYPAGDGEL